MRVSFNNLNFSLFLLSCKPMGESMKMIRDNDESRAGGKQGILFSLTGQKGAEQKIAVIG